MHCINERRLKPSEQRDIAAPFIGIDQHAWCSLCRKEINTKRIGIRAIWVVLSRLSNGLSEILVKDSECHFCNVIVPYDGRNENLFCLSEGVCVTREQLYTWLYYVCFIGNTIRDAC